ncbi:MAG: DUF305 domain-containing protein [Actinomycetales bacterium]|nr:MAG: DUF305 domain-containing protein [Actinomycetales bacterium]
MSRVAAIFLALAMLLGGFAVGHAFADPEPPVGRPTVADIGFAQDMAVHHEQAVQMSRLVQGVDGDVSVVAAQIMEAQTRESGMMRGWLDVWGAPQLPRGAPMAWMDHGVVDAGAMPGMASSADLDRLARATGEAQQRLFLQLMIRHHRGGIEMADAAVELAALPAVRSAARLMAAEQAKEIAAMTPMLARLDAPDLDGAG